MLSKVLLRFEDKELSEVYNREKKRYFRKATPIITTMLLLLSIGMELVYRLEDDDKKQSD